jgi:xanthine dehydrogenase accessory factor
VDWLAALSALRADRIPGVLVTVAGVRGHAPRAAGAKMVVSPTAVHDTIGGGNLEATAIDRARALIAGAANAPEQLVVDLNEHVRSRHGKQCCGGEVTLLLEPLAVVPSVAIAGVGHVGLELARILARHDLDLHLVDARAEELHPTRLACLDDAFAHVHVHHAPVPELVLGDLPAGTRLLVMTHDHAEDLAICDAALRSDHLGEIGLIGSRVKARRFEAMLADLGHEAATIARIRIPIGLPEVAGKQPATIAVSVAADLLAAFARESSPHEPAGHRR